ncbi:MAG: hypothetical protein JAY67_21540 [Candidatus Thiodiazotropha taylori]|nr:hypothetical protein [Candidatus Thiodiazotropha taylori]MCG7972004.1 hypothetical protein [Candidatus Thiodiazotropha taylori]
MAKTVGRPPDNSPTKRLRARAWFYYVAARLNLKSTGYVLERYFEEDKVKKDEVDKSIKRPCKYDNYQKGLFLPSKSLIEKIELSVPGSKSLIYHPFWDVATPIDDISELYIHLNKLSTDVTELLFYPGTEHGKMPIRHHQDYLKTVEVLSRKADLDAFTALIGLLQEDIIINKNSEPNLYFFSMKQTLTAFKRIIYHPPFPDIAHELYEYLCTTFFNNLSDEKVSEWVSSMDIKESCSYSYLLISIVDELRVLKSYHFPPVSCMYLIERYMTVRAYKLANSCRVASDWSAVKRLPEIRNLTKALRRWELKQTNYSTIPWS